MRPSSGGKDSIQTLLKVEGGACFDQPLMTTFSQTVVCPPRNMILHLLSPCVTPLPDVYWTNKSWNPTQEAGLH